MRLAVALPSLEPAAPQRRALDAMMAHLVARGHELEAFVEHDRTADQAPFPFFHYLRLAERHRAAAFDTALYPLGRDASPYQSVWACMHRFPGVVWFQDAIAHHLAVGGIALMEGWAGYRRLLDDTYGERGAAVAQTVASNWGTGALFRRYDLVPAAATGQVRVLAAWPALARRIATRLEGREVGVAPLGIAAPPGAAEDRPAGTGAPAIAVAAQQGDIGAEPAREAALPERTPPRRVAIMSANESYATSAVRVAAAALALEGDLDVTLCLSEPIYKAEARRAAVHRGLRERIDWQLTTSPGALAEVAAGNDVLVWLAEELQGGHRLLLLQGMAAGKPTVVPRCGLYDDLPEGAVAKLELGHTLGPAFGVLLQALRDDAALREGLAHAARDFATACPDDAAAGEMLLAELEAAAAAGPLRERPVSQPAWQAVERIMRDAAVPGGAEAVVERRIEALLGEVP
jgi:hypothetical protein